MNYVVGFLFSHNLQQVALIRKTKPRWQRGRLNGIGGKIEELETPLQAMTREFREEAGGAAEQAPWEEFAIEQAIEANDPAYKDTGFKVHFFCATGDLNSLQSQTEEKVEVHFLDYFHKIRGDLLPNIPWLVEAARLRLQGGNRFITCQ